MILVYTGKGKGKTSAAVGQTVRAHGQGLKVAFGQFMKRPDQAGEQTVLSEILQERFFACGKGFFRNENARAEHRKASEEVVQWAEAIFPSVDMLVLDESLYALGMGILHEAELRSLVAKSMEYGKHLVLTGRGMPDWLRDEADIVTEMTEIKHVFHEGQQARKGIEY